MIKKHFIGMVAATFSPMKDDGSLDLRKVPAVVEWLLDRGVKGIFVCGSTGEGLSLTIQERKSLAEAFVDAAAGRLAVFVHVGHNSIAEARELAKHAQQVGADYISAVPPFYFKPTNVKQLLDCLKDIASGAPELPFYFYNIPSLAGVALDMVELLDLADESFPQLAGIKYTAPLIHEYQACKHHAEGKYDLLYGTDEMLLSALAIGAKGFIGSTYNFAAPLYQSILRSFEEGDLNTASAHQLKSVQMVRIIVRYGGLAAQKAIMKFSGMDCGPVRRPLVKLSESEIKSLEQELRAIGYFEWSTPVI